MGTMGSERLQNTWAEIQAEDTSCLSSNTVNSLTGKIYEQEWGFSIAWDRTEKLKNLAVENHWKSWASWAGELWRLQLSNEALLTDSKKEFQRLRVQSIASSSAVASSGRLQGKQPPGASAVHIPGSQAHNDSLPRLQPMYALLWTPTEHTPQRAGWLFESPESPPLTFEVSQQI